MRMSIDIMRTIFKNEKDITDPTDVLVLLCLADWCNDEGVCFPKIKTICSKTRLSQRTIYAKLKNFEGRGWISRENREGTSNIYTLCIPPAVDAPPLDTPAPNAPTSRTDCSPSIGTIINHHINESPKTKELTPQQKMVSALAKVLNGNSTLMGRRLGRFASDMIKVGATPEKVLDMYLRGGKVGWWWKYYWKGLKGQYPNETDIRNTWGHWDVPEPVHKGITAQNLRDAGL
jgi:hypothetical protein